MHCEHADIEDQLAHEFDLLADVVAESVAQGRVSVPMEEADKRALHDSITYFEKPSFTGRDEQP